MFKLGMLILKLAVALAVVIIVYNFVAGTPEEKAKSKEIVSKVKDLAGSVFELLSSEKDKFQEGKYDNAFNKISDALQLAKQNATQLIDGGSAWAGELQKLENQKTYLQDMAQNIGQTAGNNQQFRNTGGNPNVTQEQLDGQIRHLVEETERIVNEMYGR